MQHDKVYGGAIIAESVRAAEFGPRLFAFLAGDGNGPIVFADAMRLDGDFASAHWAACAVDPDGPHGEDDLIAYRPRDGQTLGTMIVESTRYSGWQTTLCSSPLSASPADWLAVLEDANSGGSLALDEERPIHGMYRAVRLPCELIVMFHVHPIGSVSVVLSRSASSLDRYVTMATADSPTNVLDRWVEQA